MKYALSVLVAVSVFGAVATIPACSGTEESPVDGGAADAPAASQTGSATVAVDAAPLPVPDGPADNPALYGRPSTCGADAGPQTGDAGRGCYDPSTAEVLQAKAPVKGQNVCSPAAIEAVRVACLASASAAACKSAIDANKDCARCILGALGGEKPASTRAPVVLPAGGATTVINVAACASIVVGRPDCALPLSKQAACTSSACNTCAGAESASCSAAASCGACANVAYSPECTAAVADASAWEAKCRGQNQVETYTKVASFFCGAP